MSDALRSDLLTLFADLSDRVRTARPAGTIYRRTRDGIDYIYAKIDAPPTRLDTFVGRADDPRTAERVREIEHAREDARGRRETVRLLRSADFAGPDRQAGAILAAIAAAGLFDQGAVLVGTVAYTVMQPLVGRRLPAAALMTRDVDRSTNNLKLALDDGTDFAALLAKIDSSYAGVGTLDRRSWPCRFRNADGYLVDLLTPARTQRDGETPAIPGLRAGAAPLPYLKWLTADPVPTIALSGAGIAVRIPQPARYALHKLIVAQRRDPANLPKRGKDLMQARSLMTALALVDPYAIEDALSDARAQGAKGWATLVDRSLAEIARGLHSTR